MVDRPAAIVADGLVRQHGAGGQRVVDGFGQEVAPVTFPELRGPSGVGKTTTLHIVATLLRADSGRASIGPAGQLDAVGES